MHSRAICSCFLIIYFTTQIALADKPNTVAVFKGNQTVVPFEENNGTIRLRKPLAFRVPALVGGVFYGKELLVSFCDSRYEGWSDWSPTEMTVRTSYGDYARWDDARILVKNHRITLKSVVADPTAVIKGNKIYAIAASWENSPGGWTRHGSGKGWDVMLVVGTVKKSEMSSDENPDVHVEWEKPVSIGSSLPESAGDTSSAQFIGGVGSGIVMMDGTIVFPVQISNTAKDVMASILYSKNDGKTWHMGGVTEVGPSENNIIEWGRGKLLMNARHDFQPRKIFESNDMGATWKEFIPLSGVWGNEPSRRGPGCQGSFITASIANQSVMLLSLPLNRGGRFNRDNLLLWMSDGNRIFNVGRITEEGKAERSGYSSLSYVGESLYCLQESNPFDVAGTAEIFGEWDRTLALVYLPHMIDKIKMTLHKWQQEDSQLRDLGIPTDGLVGFLSDSPTAEEWMDTYGCVNASVKKAEKVDGGFRFGGGADGGAQWPVTRQGQNQRYYFTKRQFTIAATVSINGITAKDGNSVLGASLDSQGRKVLLGLGYMNSGQWYAIHEGSKQTPLNGTSFTVNDEYHVILRFTNRMASVYVNDVAIIENQLLHVSDADISHFYMGGYGNPSQDKDSRSTVKNVMLYNRALSTTEINMLVRQPEKKILQLRHSDIKDQRKVNDVRTDGLSHSYLTFFNLFSPFVCIMFSSISISFI